MKANSKRLDECDYHEFEIIGEVALGSKYKCRNCGGTVDAIAKHWYDLGQKHARKE